MVAQGKERLWVDRSQGAVCAPGNSPLISRCYLRSKIPLFWFSKSGQIAVSRAKLPPALLYPPYARLSRLLLPFSPTHSLTQQSSPGLPSPFGNWSARLCLICPTCKGYPPATSQFYGHSVHYCHEGVLDNRADCYRVTFSVGRGAKRFERATIRQSGN